MNRYEMRNEYFPKVLRKRWADVKNGTATPEILTDENGVPLSHIEVQGFFYNLLSYSGEQNKKDKCFSKNPMITLRPLVIEALLEDYFLSRDRED